MSGKSTYSEEKLKLTEEYIDNFEEHGHVIPSAIGLSMVLGVSRKTLYNWADQEENIAFLHILGKLQDAQEFVLLSKGLKNEFNSNITKLALGKHGYHEKLDQQSTMNVSISHEDAKTL